MTLQEIAALPIEHHVADDCALWLWIPGPFLLIGAHIPIMKAWGFKPSGMGFVWIKLTKDGRKLATGPGFTTRKNAEFCLLGKRGRSVRRDRGVHEVIVAPVREHSRKPEEARERIELYCAGPYLELFGREKRKGWIVRGDQVGMFD